MRIMLNWQVSRVCCCHTMQKWMETRMFPGIVRKATVQQACSSKNVMHTSFVFKELNLAWFFKHITLDNKINDAFKHPWFTGEIQGFQMWTWLAQPIKSIQSCKTAAFEMISKGRFAWFELANVQSGTVIYFFYQKNLFSFNKERNEI